MPDVVVPATPAFVTVANVELIQTGTWWLKSGPATFTEVDLYNAVAALACPAVRRPVLKLGHDGNHGIGQPTIGYIDNMAVADAGRTLVGDYAGMPGWLGDTDDAGNSVLISAYADRSIEGEWDFKCQMGHTHPFVVLAVALLGEERPGVGSVQSLQDLAELYGVQIEAGAPPAELPAPTGQRVVVEVHASREEPPMPTQRRPLQVAAAVTSEDVSRAFYNSPIGADWDHWIVRMEVDPLAIVYVDDATGGYFYLPVTIGTGSGSEAVSFGEAQARDLEFVPKTAAAAAGAGVPAPLVFTSRQDTRPGAPPPAATTPPATGPGSTNPEGSRSMDPVKLREALELSAEASDEEVQAALTAAGITTATTAPGAPAPAAPATPPAPAAPVPVAAGAANSGVMSVDASVMEDLERRVALGESANQRLLDMERDAVIAKAITDRKFAPSRKEHWETSWSKDPEGTKAAIASLKSGLIPAVAGGYPGADTTAEDELYGGLYPEEKKGAGSHA